jgi:oligopeptide transport system substrate-binding protein
MSRNQWLLTIAIVLVVCALGAAVAGLLTFGWLRGEQTTPPPRVMEEVTPEATPLPTSPPLPRQGDAVLNLPGGDPPTLDPALVGDETSARYVLEIFSGLMTTDKDLQIVPDIAESWEVSEDGTVYIFHLRQDVKFHDGRPLTAEDVKYSLERACDPTTGSITADTFLGDIMGAKEKLRGEADEISGVKVLDDYTLEITLEAPRAYFLAELTHPVAFVVDRENVEEMGRLWTDRSNGTGPFKLGEYRLGERIVLERNEFYYGAPKPALEQVIFFLTGGSAMIMYENEELDVVPVGLTDVDRVLDPTNPLNAELTIAPQWSTAYIGFNVNEPPFDDVKVRQAFNYALDREKINRVVMKEMERTARGILPPGMPGYNEDLEGFPYDPETARQLIAESKYESVENFPDIVLSVTGGGGAPFRTVSAIVEMYKENLGLEIIIEQTEWATYLTDLKTRRYQMFGVSSGWIADYPDPQDFLDVLFYGQSLDNDTEYANPEVDKLLEQARVEQDPEKRMQIYQQVEEIIVNDAPWVPLSHGIDYWLTKPYVKGMIYPPMTISKLKYVSLER